MNNARTFSSAYSRGHSRIHARPRPPLPFPRLRAAFAVAAAALAAVGLPTAAWAAGGMEALAQFVQTARTGQARFTQVVTAPPKSGQAARSKTSSGTFEFHRPGQFRFDYAKPFAQTIVADGKTLWLHDVDLEQVTARAQDEVLGATPAAIVAAASSLKALEKDFTLSDEPDSDGQQWVKAVPKSRDGQLQSIRVGFKPASGGPVLGTLEILDSFGQRSVLTFNDFQLNPSLPASRFQFTPPAGADVIRP
ncbi:outer membrane lipoprotein carrier protein LolA [Comamonadaceae bacterium OH2545_COT-014]|nr:outer membrane lipoprotein carrier protein LolA [Comamonadaceae bacterium OH2545_COT-014]